jgi:hypothetical protein
LGDGGAPGAGGAPGTGGAPGAGGAGGARPDASSGDVAAEAAVDATDAVTVDAVTRCVLPVSAGDCAGEIPRSCQELLSLGATASDAYRIDPDGPGPNLPFVTFCDMDTQNQVGWTLMGKVNTANVDGVDEPRTWFITENHPEMLTTRTFIMNQPPAAHGAYKLAALVNPSTVARFEIYAALDVTQKATWYKVVPSGASLQAWFTPNDTTPSRVCTDLALTLNCMDGTISPDGDATLMRGMSLASYGYTTAGQFIHMRLNDDNAPQNSGVCSDTLDYDNNRWQDSYGVHWGNGLLIWIR